MAGDPSTRAKTEPSSVSTTNGPPLADRFEALVSVGRIDHVVSRARGVCSGGWRRELERVVRFDFVAFVLYDPEKGVVQGDLLDAGAWRSRPPGGGAGRVAGGLGGPDAAAARRPRHVRSKHDSAR